MGGLERLEPFELLNCHHDHNWSTVLLDCNRRGSCKVDQTAEPVLGVFRCHAPHGAPLVKASPRIVAKLATLATLE
jgi:hypothetical protein